MREAVRKWEVKRWERGMGDKGKLVGYRRWKKELALEEYLTCGGKVQGARVLTGLRGSSNLLRIDRGREDGTAREERKCEVCGQEVEDEEHFMLRCVRYAGRREKMLRELGKITEECVDDFKNERWEQVMEVLMGAKAEKRGEVMQVVKEYTAEAMYARHKTLGEERE